MMDKKLYRLAAGVVIAEGDRILLVRDQHGWSLPKGSVEDGEIMKETAIREAREETGLNVTIRDVAFITEFRSAKHGRYLQVYYHAEIASKNGIPADPDKDIHEIKFVPNTSLRDYIEFKPWILALEEWVRDSTTKYHSFDLDSEGNLL